MKRSVTGAALAGSAAGFINGLFGAGGGMILIPLLSAALHPEEDEIFPASVCVMLPICVVSIATTALQSGPLPWSEAWPYLLGSAVGGAVAGKWGRKIPACWLHRGLGIMILWGGIRYLC